MGNDFKRRRVNVGDSGEACAANRMLNGPGNVAQCKHFRNILQFLSSK